MKVVRYKLNDRIGYGILEEHFVREISGSIFKEFQVLSVKHDISEVRILPPTQPSKILCAGLN